MLASKPKLTRRAAILSPLGLAVAGQSARADAESRIVPCVEFPPCFLPYLAGEKEVPPWQPGTN